MDVMIERKYAANVVYVVSRSVLTCPLVNTSWRRQVAWAGVTETGESSQPRGKHLRETPASGGDSTARHARSRKGWPARKREKNLHRHRSNLVRLTIHPFVKPLLTGLYTSGTWCYTSVNMLLRFIHTWWWLNTFKHRLQTMLLIEARSAPEFCKVKVTVVWCIFLHNFVSFVI